MNDAIIEISQVLNEGGSKRVLVTKDLPGDRWHQVLTAAGCRVEICHKSEDILSVATIKALIGSQCDGVIGQLTEVSLNDAFPRINDVQLFSRKT